jgi:hypothetical protein
VAKNVSQIYAALDNKQADHQASVVEVEGMITNHLVSILIDPSSNLSYIAPKDVDKHKLQPHKHAKPWSMIQVEPKGEFLPEPQCILDRKETPLRNQTIAQVKVQWKHFGPDEATWEMEDAMKHAYPILFTSVHTHHIDR